MKYMTRRQALRLAGCATAAIPLTALLGRETLAEDLPQLDPEDDTAKAVAYVHASENPEQLCSNCHLYTGEADSEWGPCAIFPEKAVNAIGWYKSWVKKTV